MKRSTTNREQFLFPTCARVRFRYLLTYNVCKSIVDEILQQSFNTIKQWTKNTIAILTLQTDRFLKHAH
jgi:hypothetical protein